MKLRITILFVQAFPKRYKWTGTCPDGSEYSSAPASVGSSAQAMQDADDAFRSAAITWDWAYARHAPEELGTTVHRGHVFAAQTEEALV
jgi:hypothetical protein